MFKARMWDQRYAEDGFLFGTAPAAFLTSHQDRLPPNARTLVVGDGEGRNSVFLAERGLEVSAMDISDVAVAKARRLAESRGVSVRFSVGDLLTWPWEPDAFDLVVAIFIQVLYPAERAAVFRGLAQTLRPGGTLMLHGYRPEHLQMSGVGGPPVTECMYTEATLRDAFPDFDVDVLHAYEAELAESEAHHGQSALIDFIARKP